MSPWIWLLPQGDTGWLSMLFTVSTLVTVALGTILIGSISAALAGAAVASMALSGRPGARFTVPLAVLCTLIQVALTSGFLVGILGSGVGLLSMATALLADAALLMWWVRVRDLVLT